MKKIARSGNLRWESEHEDAGPYYLSNMSRVFVSFGTRTLKVSKPGSMQQREQFLISKATFEGLKLAFDPIGLKELTGDQLALAAKEAAKIARSNYKRWASSIVTYGRDIEYVEETTWNIADWFEEV